MRQNLRSRVSLFGLCLLVCLILACGGGGSPSSSPFGDNYFPRTQNNESLLWKYRKTFSDGATVNTEVWFTGEDVFNDQPSYTFEEAEDGAPNIIRHYKIKDGVQWLGSNVGLSESHSQFHLLVFDMVPGSSRNFSDAVSGAVGGIHQYKFERMPDEQLIVPAGTFSCSKFVVTTTGVSGDLPLAIGNVKTMWFAANVGLVRLTDVGSLDVKNDLLMELMSLGTKSL